jgi:transcription antitermination protein NusB
MGARTAAREAALQMLYAAEIGRHSAETLLKDFWREFPGDAEGRPYADNAVRGVLEKRAELDARVVSASVNWRLERMSPIARNVLRLGTWELLFQPEVPRAVIIDESVEVAKRYGGTESGAFVNGVLDRIANDCGRPQDSPRARPSAPPAPSAAEEPVIEVASEEAARADALAAEAASDEEE